MKKKSLVIYTIIVLSLGIILGQLTPVFGGDSCGIDLPNSRASIWVEDENTLNVRVYKPFIVTQAVRLNEIDVKIKIRKQ